MIYLLIQVTSAAESETAGEWCDYVAGDHWWYESGEAMHYAVGDHWWYVP